jgi:hypothetical protein
LHESVASNEAALSDARSLFLTPSKFKLGDRVRTAAPIASGGREPVGIVTGFDTPAFADYVGAPDDVRVRWDTGVELLHAPASLVQVSPDA